MINELLLLSGNDIPFFEAQVNIHQPTIKEIAYIGEESFFIGCEFLRFTKNNLSEEDKIGLENSTDFDIIMSIMNDKTSSNFQKNSISAKSVLTLLFPNYEIVIEKDKIVFIDESNLIFSINNKNYNAFKQILVSMFCLKENEKEEAQYNPQSELAKKIANKLKKGRKKAKEQKALQNDKQKKIAILSRYVSILSVGERKDMNSLLQYTVYQLFDELDRFELKTNYDIFVKAKMAGVKDLKEVENWMKDIHS